MSGEFGVFLVILGEGFVVGYFVAAVIGAHRVYKLRQEIEELQGEVHKRKMYFLSHRVTEEEL